MATKSPTPTEAEPAIVQSGFAIVDRHAEPPAFVLLREFLETKIPLGKMGMFKLAMIREEDRLECLAYLDRLSAPAAGSEPWIHHCKGGDACRIEPCSCGCSPCVAARAVENEAYGKAGPEPHPGQPCPRRERLLEAEATISEWRATSERKQRTIERLEAELAERTAEVERLKAALDGLLSTITQLDADVGAASGAALEKAFATGRAALDAKP